ncbi:MAG: sugar ABC transporter ATP-binding protein [candidate division KSB1 bacterium]|nr:sugar ABC transporter ATP-binding protein [candidate division KSB1 bacterium]MDZ7402053.1 sugar ABC transporter ATP-binding protein [candidate division KSB1 bacterium]
MSRNGQIVQPILKMQGITKEFPGVVALKSVDFELLPGEVHALVGENGAGKSTLIKILSGAVPRSSGQIYLDGQCVEINNPLYAQTLGIAVIYQELMLAPALSAAENILLGRFPKKWKLFINRKRLLSIGQELSAMLGLAIDLRLPLKRLTVAQQQLVEVAKALSLNARIIVMDEPSAVLTPKELEKLFDIIDRLRQQGKSFIYISHRLDEIFRIADRVTVLKDGVVQGTRAISEVTRQQLIAMMVGRDLNETVHPRPALAEEGVALEVKELRCASLPEPISFKLYVGEILGVAGLVGSGRSELIRTIFGAEPKLSGKILIDGHVVDIRSPADAVKFGLGLIPEDRKAQALFHQLPVVQNITIANLKPLVRLGFIRSRLEARSANTLVDQLKIRLASIQQRIENLSGGNQQKAVLARWLSSKAKIILFDEPTRGIDVASKAQIHQLMRQLAAQGVSIIMISSELPEILEMSDRIMVLHDGKITGVLSREEATEEKIMSLATR